MAIKRVIEIQSERDTPGQSQWVVAARSTIPNSTRPSKWDLELVEHEGRQAEGLCRDESSVPSPAWHEKILQEL
jgi:hypothetical protein